MNNALLSILCDQEYWSFDPLASELITFNKDGTGELWCMRETTFIFALNMDWKSLPPPKAEESVKTLGITSWWSRKPQVLGKVKLQINLNTTDAKSLGGPFPIPNEYYLSEAAFRPRIFTVTIEKGNFAPKLWVGKESEGFRLRYGLRLLFDKSPYPLREGFKTPDKPPVSEYNFDEMDMFVAGLLSHSETKGKAMNDDFPGGWTTASLFRW
ncbi:hypothetical protein M433DRAFT_142208 [Acidomyces richmondensis BFW]|nr:MAG: hypothetical protein FE78DRAFT_68949 [Acidomyces sp. 'richmondensis']KYG47201.1 hypothetical protein M433DRAFT_142208 [Acidomyces richmondensis BFW]